MSAQKGTLVIIVKECRTTAALHAGTYFVFKVGKRCTRFDRVFGELVFELDDKDSSTLLEIFVFRRRVRKRGAPLGRRRDLLDKRSDDLFKASFLTRKDTVIEWKSYEINFEHISLSFILDVEFYPRVPLLPGKGLQRSENLSKTTTDDVPIVSHTMKPLPTPPAAIDIQKASKIRTRKRDKLKIPQLYNRIRVSKDEDKEEPANTANTIFYDLTTISKNHKPSIKYEHGLSLPQENLAVVPMKPEELYTFIKFNQHQSSTDQQLSLDILPQSYFQSRENRMTHDHKLNFFSSFSSSNVKLTGYLGSGRWMKLNMSATFMNWYLRSDIAPVTSPELPPKCPLGMLWEEYYLTNKDQYMKDVLR